LRQGAGRVGPADLPQRDLHPAAGGDGDHPGGDGDRLRAGGPQPAGLRRGLRPPPRSPVRRLPGPQVRGAGGEGLRGRARRRQGGRLLRPLLLPGAGVPAVGVHRPPGDRQAAPRRVHGQGAQEDPARGVVGGAEPHRGRARRDGVLRGVGRRRAAVPGARPDRVLPGHGHHRGALPGPDDRGPGGADRLARRRRSGDRPVTRFLDEIIRGWGHDPGTWPLTQGVYLVAMLLVATGLVTFGAVFAGMVSWWERRVAGRMQSRIGPNRVGPGGFLQWIADALKLMLKEDLIPEESDHVLFRIAPYFVMVGFVLTFVVLPFGYQMSATNMNVGLFYVVS